MESLQSMRVFVKVVQASSFSAAGRAIGLSPASVSRHISALEEELGARLINRTSRKLAPTNLGLVYYEKASRILEQLDEMADAIAEQQASPRGLLHVHTRVIVGHHFLSPAMPVFLARHPQIAVRLWLSEEPRDVIDHKIDVAIRFGNLDEPSLVARKLLTGVERILFASPAYLEGRPAITEPEDLLSHNCLTFPLDGRLEQGNAAWFFRERGGDGSVRELRMSGSLQVNDGPSLRLAALAGHGVALLPAWLVAEDIRAGRLRRVLAQYEATPTQFDHSIYAVYHRSPRPSPKVRAFLEFLAELFEGHQAEMARAADVAGRTGRAARTGVD